MTNLGSASSSTKSRFEYMFRYLICIGALLLVESSSSNTTATATTEKASQKRKVYAELMRELYSGESPYVSVNAPDNGYTHTNVRPEMIESVLNYAKPLFWLEVGSMLGGSAIMTAKVIKSLGMDSTSVICMDPFTGDVNMWDWERDLHLHSKWKYLNIQGGRPTIYDRFRGNVMAHGQDDVILPFTLTSIVGFKLLKRMYVEGRIKHLPNVIYLDSAHEKDETFIELQKAWVVLAPRGVLMGDDWSWSAVREDVQRFVGTVETYACKLPGPLDWNSNSSTGVLLLENEWVLCKP